MASENVVNAGGDNRKYYENTVKIKTLLGLFKKTSFHRRYKWSKGKE